MSTRKCDNYPLIESFTVLSRGLIVSPKSFFALLLSIFLGKLIIFSIDSFVRFSNPGKNLPLKSAAFLRKDLGNRLKKW